MTPANDVQSRFFRNEFGVRDQELAFADDVERLLSTLSGNRSPFSEHPYSAFIQVGSESIPVLWDLFDRSVLENHQKALVILDAIILIQMGGGTHEDHVKRARAAFEKVENVEVRAALARSRAIGRDEDFIREQISLLANEDPMVSSMAAQLLGYAREERALVALHPMLSPEFYLQSEAVVWALSEIGSIDSLPFLSRAANAGFRTSQCLEAIGKIGSLVGLVSLQGYLSHGAEDEMEAAWRALAEIINQNRDRDEALAKVKEDVEMVALDMLERGDLAVNVRVSMLICLSRLDVSIKRPKLLQYLGLSVDAAKEDQLASFFMNRAS